MSKKMQAAVARMLLPAKAAPITIETVPLSLQFIGGYGLESDVIERVSLGPLSHVDAVARDGGLWGWRSDKVRNGDKKIAPGLQPRPPGYFGRARCCVVMTLQVSPAQYQQYWDWLIARKGTPYDSIGILAMAANRDWREDGAYFCSEGQGRDGEVCKLYPKLFTPSNRLTPVALATVWSAIGATTQEIPIAA